MRVINICRGRGSAYLEVKLTCHSLHSNVKWEAESEQGSSLPLESYLMKTDESGLFRIFVLVTPLLNTKVVIIRAYEISIDKTVLETDTLSLSRWMIKWSSRLNYRFRKEETHLLRDTDNYTYSQQVHVKPTMFFDAPAHDRILKGIVCYPATDDIPKLNMIDGNGIPIADFSFSLGRATHVFVHGFERQELSFTVRIPHDGKTYCIVAGNDGDCRSGFLCLDQQSQKAYLSGLAPYMYPASSSVFYGPRMAERARIMRTLVSADFAIENGPCYSVIVPLYKTPVGLFNAMVDSVEEQIYPNWELILVNSTPEDEGLTQAIGMRTDSRIRVVTLEKNLGIAGNTNAGIEMAAGDFVVFFDHDDVLDRFALYEYAKRFVKDRSIDAFYCDEDFLDESGQFVAPHYKSDFNLDLLRSHNYITHLLAVKSSLAKELMLRSEFDGAQDYDFLLRLVEKTHRFSHVQEVLYHWRISDTSTAKSSGNKNYADEAGRKALQEHYDRVGIDAVAERTDSPCYYHTVARVQGLPLVSIIIPNKDNCDVLKRCIDSVYEKTVYSNFEIIIAENNSTEAETFNYYRNAMAEHDNLRVITWDSGFNYSAINNFAALEAKGEYFLFLNNDIEVINPDWMTTMVAYCQREDVGIVGAKLLYPDDTIQHAGVIMMKCGSVNELGGPIHVFHDIDRDDPGYMRRASLTQDLSAVTAACMMTKASVFNELGGFSEKYVVAFNDVDYCLRVRAKGLLVVYNPDVLLYHYESVSRGSDTSGKNAERFMREQCMLRSDWTEYYIKGDPYHGPASTHPVLPF